MLARAAAVALLSTNALAQDLNAEGTGRDLLFSNPGAELPDVYLSQSVLFASEGDAKQYSVVLTHPPGMREDETIDLDNDEVRIYLTSSQEVFQQDDSGTGGGATVQFEQRRNHRTQLIIYTNDVNGDTEYDSAPVDGSGTGLWSKFAHAETTLWSDDGVGNDGFEPGSDDLPNGTPAPAPNVQLPLGPLPYVYKTYSTVGGNTPEQQSPVAEVEVDGNMVLTLLSVCPVCTHPAYCTLYDGSTPDPLVSIDTTDPMAGSTRVIPGSAMPDPGGGPDFQGCYQVKITYAPVMDMCATDPDTVVSDLNPLNGPCQKAQDGFTIYDGLLPRQAGGSHPNAPGWSYESPTSLGHTMPGNSDYRIDEIGDQVLRTRSDPRPLCRYSNCPELTVNGGDQQPESPNFLQPSFDPSTGGGSWRGDLTSSAQLVFDSTNWEVAQTVTVVARQDDVYEPEVNNRGQDAYVHHFVVAQDINLEHTYYDDIEVNDLTISITDDDPAVVIESHNEVNPSEGGPNSEVKLRLASEPMYPVTVYLQSGPFFGDSDTTLTAADFLPDDEQVIFQDRAQYETCWSTDSTLRTYTYDLVRDQPESYRSDAGDLDHGGTFNYQGCFEGSGGAFTLVNAPIDERAVSATTRQIEATMQCHGDDRCTYKDAGGSGAAVPLPNGAYPRDNFFESRESLVSGSSCTIVACSEVDSIFDSVGHYVETGQEAGTHAGGDTSPIQETVAGTAQRSCKNDGNFLTLRTYSSTGQSHLPTTGYTCNSYVTFSTTNWDTWQTLDVIGVNDDMDEGEFRISEIGYLYESKDWYYNSAGSQLMTSANAQYTPTENSIVAGDARDQSGGAAPAVHLSMFDTRFGKHINRYPRVAGGSTDDDAATYGTADQKTDLDAVYDNGEWSSADTDAITTRSWEAAFAANTQLRYSQANGGGGGYYGSPALWGTPCHGNSQCRREAPFHDVAGIDAKNEVCCCEDPATPANQNWVIADLATKVATGGGDATQTYSASFGQSGSRTAEDSLQTQNFQPEEYAGRNVQCGGQVVVTDNNKNGVTISRTDCEATEGRRFWFDTFQQEPTPMECDMDGGLYSLDAAGSPTAPMDVTLGLFAAVRSGTGAYIEPAYSGNFDRDVSAEAIPSFGSINGIGGIDYEVDNGRIVAQAPGGAATIAYRQAGSCSDGVSETETACAAAGGAWDSTSTSAETDTHSGFTTETPSGAAAYNTVRCPSANADGWTMTDTGDDSGDYKGMTAPVCPYTIVLDSAPKEGATVVVHLREDYEKSNLRDHELYFYEEASYRPGVTQDECTTSLYPGSSWVNNGCFIHNVPMTASDGIPVPRGSVDLDVMFTDDDWNVPRRITTIALNDDVDEPTEVRTIYHTTSGCEGFNHNSDETCIEDPTYTGISVASVDVIVVDDDIADLVVIGDDGYVCTSDPSGGACAGSEANIIDESFIGSYDAAGPKLDLTVNYWYQRFERQGPYAEDGISGSNFQGRSQDHTQSRGDTMAFPTSDPGNAGSTDFDGTDPQILNDGIGGGGFQLSARGDGLVGSSTAANVIDNGASITGGYITDNEDPLCLNPDPMQQDDRCFRIDDVAWTHYDPYWDTYVADDTGYTAYDAAQPRDVFDGCTPTGSNGGDATRLKDWMFNGASGNCGAELGATAAQPNRGFKGIGPAYTEPEDEFAVTIHSRECRNDVLGSDSSGSGSGNQNGGANAFRQDFGGAEPEGVDEDGEDCLYGTFQVRLNSSPGTKHVRKRYIGEADTVLEEELVKIVVTPDVTPQTMFDPPSVTFTHTGGDNTQRWDAPFRFKVVPVDDEVDERAGVTIDFTSFTIEQSHFGDEYWTYTTPYQTIDDVGSMTVAGDSNTGRTDGHTPFRHHIRTIHTRDNDYAGVTVEKPDVQSMTQTADGPNYLTTNPVGVSVTEGESFGFYTLRLKSQPRKVQRQAGTNPNDAIITGDPSTQSPGAARADFDHETPGGRVDITDSTLYTTSPGGGADGADPAGIYHGKHVGMATAEDNCDHEDFSDVTRPSQCGSVEAEQDYWVDVTVTQTIHLDLAEPGSCPDDAPWGGGRTPPTTEHPRFPFNANAGKPINELVETADDLDTYLSTCGGWQRDATYRFTADNWNVPQYVYLYAHNDKDAAPAGNDVDLGGNEESSPTTTVLKHYVETQDTLDNAGGVYVQRNKHGAQYTSGNSERYPFGVISGDGWGTSQSSTAHTADTGTTTTNQPIQGADNTQEPILTEPFGNRETGFSTYGYSDYSWLYGYYHQEHTWTGVHYAQTPCGAVHMGAGIGHATDATNSADSTTNVGIHYAWDYATTDIHDTTLYGTDLPIAARAGESPVGGPDWDSGYAQPNAGGSLDFAGEICEDPFDNLKPYTQVGTHCVPIRSDTVAAHSGVTATPSTPNPGGGAQVDSNYERAEAVTASPGPNDYGNGPVTATGTGATMGTAATTDNGADLTWNTLNNMASGVEQHYCVPKYATKNGGMKFKPIDVTVTVTDNDDIADQDPKSVTDCRQTSLFSSTIDGSGSSEWLVDVNCRSGDAGGLPGYPMTGDIMADTGGNLAPHTGSGAGGAVLGDAGVPGDEQCANGRVGAYCTDCPAGQVVDGDGCTAASGR